jgi:hypothetical protein
LQCVCGGDHKSNAHAHARSHCRQVLILVLRRRARQGQECEPQAASASPQHPQQLCTARIDSFSPGSRAPFASRRAPSASRRHTSRALGERSTHRSTGHCTTEDVWLSRRSSRHRSAKLVHRGSCAASTAAAVSFRWSETPTVDRAERRISESLTSRLVSRVDTTRTGSEMPSCSFTSVRCARYLQQRTQVTHVSFS